MAQSSRIVVALGTRPEIIKMGPVVHKLRTDFPDLEIVVFLTGQHSELADEALRVFGITVDLRVDVMSNAGNLNDLIVRIIAESHSVLRQVEPKLVLVHGDTSTAMGVAIAAHHLAIPIAHIEAGLRSFSLNAPWPEEANRRIVDSLSSLHFAPTSNSAENLVAEGHSGSVFMTGNTVVDALTWAVSQLGRSIGQPRDPKRVPSILVTQHRRENFGDSHASILSAIAKIARSGVRVNFPVHPNPNIGGLVVSRLGSESNVNLLPPLGYLAMVELMMDSDLVLTDSGGLQEEAPSLGIPVLVTRTVTERREALECGAAKLVGTTESEIVSEALSLLEFGPAYDSMANAGNPFGDGRAADRICVKIQEFVNAG